MRFSALSPLSRLFLLSLCLLGISRTADAATVNMIWTGVNTNGVDIVAMSGNSVTLDHSGVATLTLDMVLDIDSLGVSGYFLRSDFDSDLDNELNLLSWAELSWSNGMGSRTLVPDFPGIHSSQESTGSQPGFIYFFDGFTIGFSGPTNTTLTFARLIFETTPARSPTTATTSSARVGSVTTTFMVIWTTTYSIVPV